jgi:hypothetical protein
MQQEDHPMPTQGHIALAAQTRIMHFDAELLAVQTLCSLVGADHFDFNAAVWLELLAQYAQSRQIQGDDNPLGVLCSLHVLDERLFYDMLHWYGLSSVDLM